MAAAAALRSAARKVCGRAFERPQSYFTKAGEVLPHDSPLLFKDIHPDTLVSIPISTSPWSADNPKFLSNVKKLVLGTLIAGSAVVYLEAMYIFRYDVSEAK